MWNVRQMPKLKIQLLCDKNYLWYLDSDKAGVCLTSFLTIQNVSSKLANHIYCYTTYCKITIVSVTAFKTNID